ncbi:hypothetical protein PPYR_12325 [Photinus pyralis]|uniref:C2H2-type domain-containing protein n=1 Tax=Photinus pyralis TaxID=7054 RepID=A0A1Y1LB35_PHOPY|nr:hypothetical protein PPYR_12325 [Photinus pyralis]
MLPERVGFLSGEVDILIESVTPEYETELTLFLSKQVLLTNEVPKNVLDGNTNLALLTQSLQKSSSTAQSEKATQGLLAAKKELKRLRKFVCSQCGYVTRLRSGYLDHVKQCDLSQNFQCEHCDFRAKSKSGLFIHINGCHSLCQYKCDLCDFTTKWKTSLQPHFCKLHASEKPSFTTERRGGTVQLDTQSLGKFVCSPCGYATNLKRSYFDHIKHCDLLKIFQCKFCKYKCRSKPSLMVHINGRHKLCQFSCKVCDFTTSWKNSLREHFIRKHGTHKYVYDIVKGAQLSSGRLNLKRSAIKPNNHRPFQCAQCNYSTKSKYYLRTHMHTSHGAHQYECDLCPFTTKWKSSIRLHINSSHGANAVPRVTSRIRLANKDRNEQFYCAHCNYKTVLKTSLSIHVHGRHGLNHYRCEQCNFTTKWKSSLKSHLSKVHGITKRDDTQLIKCELCDFKSGSTAALLKHISRYHHLRKYACKQCKFTTNWKSSLNEHARRRHGTLKPSFTYKVTEENIDTVVSKKQTEFQCAHCEYKSKHRGCLVTHLNGRHSLRRHKCELCTFETRWENSLKEHTRRVHSEKKARVRPKANLVRHFNSKH